MLSHVQPLPAKYDREEVLTTVKKIIAEYSTIDAENIREEHHLERDLGLDSLDIVEISMELEEQFDISIPDDESERAGNVGVIVNGILQLLERR